MTEEEEELPEESTSLEGNLEAGEDAENDPDGEIVAGVESRLEQLADDISDVLATAPAADRESLHDYAVSLVRERLPVAEFDERHLDTAAAALEAKASRRGTAPLAYGILVLMVAPLLLLVFPPVGMMLLLGGTAMVLWGLASGLLLRFRPTEEGSDTTK